VFQRLFAFLRRILTGRTVSPGSAPRTRVRGKHHRKPKLQPLRYRPAEMPVRDREVETKPYSFARFGSRPGTWRDLSSDGNDALLARFQLPVFHTPDELAAWLQMPVGQLAWLTKHCTASRRAENVAQSHYHYRWLRKRSGGLRLIEIPKPRLKAAQKRILAEVLQKIPPHAAVHGFVPGRSIVTNAAPHVGRRVVIRLDLENFYANVGFSRVTAIFRRIGYSREAALWLARLTTSSLPMNTPFPETDAYALTPYIRRHLPQGASTSPALANLAAHALDVRLAGFATSFGANYTRYADDLTFSGSQSLIRALPAFLPLATKIVRSERFTVNVRKRRVIRSNQRQRVTGVVVNSKMNVSRRDFDRLKAILTNCLRHGPQSQNRDRHPDFAAHLRGRIAHVSQLNPQRGEKLRRLFERIHW
jgi:RNA-directed DNA polymerase